jgi:hypothetical protein
LHGDYNAPQVISQGQQRAMYGLDGGLKYDLTKALNLSANVRDMFNSRKFGSIIDYTGWHRQRIHSESDPSFPNPDNVGYRCRTVLVQHRMIAKRRKRIRKIRTVPDDKDGGNPDDPSSGGGAGNTGARRTGAGTGAFVIASQTELVEGCVRWPTSPPWFDKLTITPYARSVIASFRIPAGL